MIALFVIGRIIFGCYFIYNGINHLSHVPMMAGYAKSKGVPAPSLAVFVSGLFILLGGLSVLLGIYPVAGIILITLFLIPVSFFMHRFWDVQDPMARMGEHVNFLKNMALIGALLMFFLISRPWPVSLVQ